MAKRSTPPARKAGKPKTSARRKPARATPRRKPAAPRASDPIGRLTREQTVPADAPDLLMQDHREAESLFEQFEQTEEPDRLAVLARRICLALSVHAILEEEIFYPAARELLEDDPESPDLLDEAEVEHAAAKALIAEIQAMMPREPLFRAKVKVLGEYVMHHVREEETRLFPKLREIGLEAYPLGADLAARKVALLFAHRSMLGLPTAGKRRTPARRKSKAR